MDSSIYKYIWMKISPVISTRKLQDIQMILCSICGHSAYKACLSDHVLPRVNKTSHI